MVTGAAIVSRARSYLGQHENPMGSNRGTFVQECQAASFLGGTGWPWCAAFVDKVCAAEGVSLAPNNSAGAHDLADRHRANWVLDHALWEPGMVVDYNEGSGHTGVLTGVDRAAGTVTSCDGNWSDAVVEHTMPISIIRAVWKIPGVTYAGGSAPPVVAKPTPVWVVATSASGHRRILFITKVANGGKHRVTRWFLRHSLARVAPNGITIRRGSRVLK